MATVHLALAVVAALVVTMSAVMKLKRDPNVVLALSAATLATRILSVPGP